MEENNRLTDERDRAKQYAELLTAHQRDMYAYIKTLLVGDVRASDVLQDTNLDLWARLDDYDFDRPFIAWAFGFAYRRILVYRKAQRRKRVLFTDDVLNLISESYTNRPAIADKRLAALKECLKKLNRDHSELIRERYQGKVSVKAMAARLEMTINQVSVRLYRIRRSLSRCIEATLVRETP